MEFDRPGVHRLECRQQCLAIGDRSLTGGPGSYLLTQTLPDTEASNFVDLVLPTLPPSRASCIRQTLSVALARLLVRMHDAGITHHDLHAGNILVRHGNNDAAELFLIDLHAVALGPPLDWDQARANLVMLNGWFIMRAERSDRLRFWKEYYRLRQEIFPPPLRGTAWVVDSHELAQELEHTTWQANLRFWQRRDRRCLEVNRYYQQVLSGPFTGHAVRDLDVDELAHLMQEPDKSFQRPGVVLLKDSRTDGCGAGYGRRRVRRRVILGGSASPVHRSVADARARSSAMRSWIHGQGLRRGLHANDPVLCASQVRQHEVIFSRKKF